MIATNPSTPTLNHVRDVLVTFGQAHPEISSIRVFGSVARGEGTPESDVDMVVHFIPNSLPHGMAGFAFLDDLERELSIRLGYPVDLIDQEALDDAKRIGNNALPSAVARDACPIYELESTAGRCL